MFSDFFKLFLKIVGIILLSFFLVQIQLSFLAGFSFNNLPLFFVIIFNLIEKENSCLGIFAAVFSGLTLDLYFSPFFGYFTLIFLCLSLFIKFVFLRYVKLPFLAKI